MALRDYLNFPTRQELIDFDNVLAHGQAVAVLGHNTLNDMPQETWYFDENSTATPDNVTVIHPSIIPQGEPGRYHINMVQADWNNLFNKPVLSTVALSGSYNDLNNKLTAGSGILMNNNQLSVDNTQFLSLSSANQQFSSLQTDINSKIPQTRTLTINGLTQDFSSNRSWQVSNVSTDQNYSDPTWISSIAVSKVTGLASVGLSGSYSDLTNKPFIPDNTSQLINGAGFIAVESDPTVPAHVKNITTLTISTWNGKQDVTLAGTGLVKNGNTLAIDDSNVMTVPNANAAIASINSQISGKVSSTRTITINGVTQDLSNDRIWTVNVPAQVSQLTNDSNFITSSQARGAISLTTTGTSGAATYNTTTGVLNIPNYATASNRTFNNSATKSINGTGVQISTTRDASVSYSITHTIALTLVLTAGSSQVFLEVSPNNSTWTTINQAGYSDGVAVAVALTKSTTNNVQGTVPAGWFVRLRAVTSGAGSAAFTSGQEVLI